jgi:carbamoyl-phosphate synthase large subunit
VVKVPRFTFEKFRQTEQVLTTSMRSVGEAMAIGRTFKEALQKALRSLEIGVHGLDDIGLAPSLDALRRLLATAGPDRVFHVKQAYQSGLDTAEIYKLTMIDPWFLDNIKQIVEFEADVRQLRKSSRSAGETLSREKLFEAKQYGFSDVQLARLLGTDEKSVRDRRKALGVAPVFKCVDTCAAEFEAFTPYYYSTYEQEAE